MRDIHTGKNQKRRGVKITSRNFDLCTHRVLILTYLELYDDWEHRVFERILTARPPRNGLYVLPFAIKEMMEW